MTTPLRDTLQLLEQRAAAYHQWETAFRSVLCAKATATPEKVQRFFQEQTQSIAQAISRVSLALREIASSSSSSSGSNNVLAKWIESIQQHERRKFEATVNFQKLLMAHMRGEGCATFVHELDCAVYQFCFGFIGGTALAAVTAAAPVAQKTQKARDRNAIDVSSSGDDSGDDGGGHVPVTSSPSSSCATVSAEFTALLQKIRDAEEAVTDIAAEIQAEISDA